MSIFEEQVSRKPNLYPWTEKFRDAMWQGFWTPDEFTFDSDIQDYLVRMDERQKKILVRTLVAIGNVEIQIKRYWANIGNTLPHPSIIDLGFVFANTETVHSEAYTRLLEKLNIEDEFEESLKDPVFGGRINYLRKYNKKVYTDDKKQFIYSIILFTIYVENVSLFAQFYIACYLNKAFNFVKDTNQQILYTSKEEAIHYLAGCEIIKSIRKEFPDLFDKELEDRVLLEAGEALKAESNIVDWILDGYTHEANKAKLNPNLLKSYIESRINASLQYIGFPAYSSKKGSEETEWFDVINGTYSDFFAERPTEYTKKWRGITGKDLQLSWKDSE